MDNKVWIITDTHFNHRKMVEYCTRPENFDELIWKRLKIINENDLLIHLGDICIGKDNEVHAHLNGLLRCKKILVKGNHDKNSNNWYLRNGWDFVCNTFSDYYFGKNILFSHIPHKDIGYDINIHGHCHTTPRTKDNNPDMNDKQILLAIENTNYQPVLLNTLISSYIKNYENRR